jgi:hypothetical protein
MKILYSRLFVFIRGKKSFFSDTRLLAAGPTLMLALPRFEASEWQDMARLGVNQLHRHPGKRPMRLSGIYAVPFEIVAQVRGLRSATPGMTGVKK